MGGLQVFWEGQWKALDIFNEKHPGGHHTKSCPTAPPEAISLSTPQTRRPVLGPIPGSSKRRRPQKVEQPNKKIEKGKEIMKMEVEGEQEEENESEVNKDKGKEDKEYKEEREKEIEVEEEVELGLGLSNKEPANTILPITSSTNTANTGLAPATTEMANKDPANTSLAQTRSITKKYKASRIKGKHGWRSRDTARVFVTFEAPIIVG